MINTKESKIIGTLGSKALFCKY